MGTPENGIFDDDLALAVKGDFEDALEKGLSVNAAAEKILQEYSDVLKDEEEGPIVYLSLAALQFDHNSLHQDIKDRALDIIETGRGLELWEEAGKEFLAERQETLKKLKLKLSAE